MGIEKQEMYSVSCDNCGEHLETVYTEEQIAIDHAIDYDWVRYRDDFFCPNCVNYGEYGELIVKHKKS